MKAMIKLSYPPVKTVTRKLAASAALLVTLRNITRSLAALRLRGSETRKPIAGRRFKLTAVVLLLTAALPIAAQPSNFQVVFSADFNTGIPPQVTGPADFLSMSTGGTAWAQAGRSLTETCCGIPSEQSPLASH